MEGGLHPGRLGAGALVLAAMMALAQALDSCQTSERLPLVAVRSPPLRATVAARRGGDHQVFRGRLALLPSLTPAPTEVIPPGRAAINVPILMYHYIRANPNAWDRMGFGLSVTPGDFEAQVAWLA